MCGMKYGTLTLLLSLLVACGTEDDDDSGVDAGTDSTTTVDSAADTGAADTATADTGTPDGGASEDAPATDTVDAADVKAWECVVPAGGPLPDSVPQLGCEDDFLALATRPIDASIPGARSLKTVIDRQADLELYFLNAEKYPIHYTFAKEHLSGNGLPLVGDIGSFSAVEYYSPNRRFLLGAITYYEEPDVWAYEIAPYDTSLPDMVITAFRLIRENTSFGTALVFHPTSAAVEKLATSLPADIPVVTSKQLFAGVTYQPLNLGTALGQVRYLKVSDLEVQAAFVTPRDIAVLDRVPNDISVSAALITAELQTPLSHVNVLSQNRGTPNMALVDALTNPTLKALEGKWVKLVVDPFAWTIEEVTKEEADAWFEAHKPPPVEVPALDLTVTELRDCQHLDPSTIPAFGGKASHYGVLLTIGDKVPVVPAFAIPVYYYKQFEAQNGFDKTIAAMLADETFNNDIAFREKALASLRAAMKKAPIDPAFIALLLDKLNKDFPGKKMRFRSSTNAEDLGGFTGAGLYTSAAGDPNDPNDTVQDAVRTVWASLWNFRAFEERSFRGIDHQGIAMAVLSHQSFPHEDAQGVALTANLFDPLEPAFYVNVQKGDVSVVLPPPGVTTDQFLYFYTYPGQPIVFIGHSNLIAEGATVLTAKQTYTLGTALDAIHKTFAKWYGTDPKAFYAMDVEFKFDTPPGATESELIIKQARPHPGWAVGVE